MRRPTREELLLLSDRPSIIRSTAFYGSLRIIMLVAGLPLTLAGLSFIAASAVSHAFFSSYILEMEAEGLAEVSEQGMILIQCAFGMVAFSFSLLLLFIAYLCKVIIKRNYYILDMEEKTGLNIYI